MRELRRFLHHHRLTEAQFASSVGVDRSLVHRWLDGAIPSPDKMRQIYRFTMGAVRPDHFYDLPRLAGKALDPDGAGAEADTELPPAAA